MRKYNKPEIETLALETIDVIQTSATRAVEAVLGEKGLNANSVAKVEQQIVDMDTSWQW